MACFTSFMTVKDVSVVNEATEKITSLPNAQIQKLTEYKTYLIANLIKLPRQMHITYS